MTYWENTGKYQTEYDALKPLLPLLREADKPHIELLRKLGNVYYDCYNNGGCNLDGYKGEQLKEILSSLVVVNGLDARTRGDIRVTLEEYSEELQEAEGYREFDCESCGGDGVIHQAGGAEETCSDCDGFGFYEDEIEGPGYLSDFCGEKWIDPLEKLADFIIAHAAKEEFVSHEP